MELAANMGKLARNFEIESMPADRKRNQEIGSRLELTRRALGFNGRGGQTAFLKDLNNALEAMADPGEQPLQVSVQRWNAFECGRQRITVDVVMGLYSVFGIDYNWIYLGRRGGLEADLLEKIRAVEAADRQH